VVTGSRRGLTALGTGLLAVVLGGVGALIDTVVFGELGFVFGVTFVFGCVFSAARVHVDDLIGVVIMPPLAYAVIIIGKVFIDRPGGGGGSGGGLRNNAIDVGSEMILRAPVLLIAFGLVVIIAFRRGQLAKASRRARGRYRDAPPTRRRAPRR
jgi:hypothetical protein